jgi:hypothetical protein
MARQCQISIIAVHRSLAACVLNDANKSSKKPRQAVLRQLRSAAWYKGLRVYCGVEFANVLRDPDQLAPITKCHDFVMATVCLTVMHVNVETAHYYYCVNATGG